MSYEIRAHTADVAVAASGESMARVFELVAEGLAATMSDSRPSTGSRYSINVSAEGPQALLFDYLDELIYQRDIENVLPVDHEVRIDHTGSEWTVEGSFRGIPLEGLGGREVKAVTYSEMVLEETERGWDAYVVFDV